MGYTTKVLDSWEPSKRDIYHSKLIHYMLGKGLTKKWIRKTLRISQRRLNQLLALHPIKPK